MNYLKRIIDFKDLLLVFIWREFTIRYKQSAIGILWAVFQPLSMMLLFTFIFTYVMPVKVADYPYAIFFYSGILPWSFFASALNYSIPSLTNHYNLITKIYFPREILPMAGIAVAFIDFLIASSFYILLLIYFGVDITLNILWFFPLLILLFMLTLSVSLVLSSLNVYYRDVKLATAFLLQLWFFATPIFYSIDRVPVNVKLLLFLNPLTFVVENLRRCVVEGRGVIWWQYLLLLTLVSGMLIWGYRFFIKTERKFADVI